MSTPVLIDFAHAALAVLALGFVALVMLLIAYLVLAALSGAGETNDGEIEPPAHPSAPAAPRPDQEAAL